jgi:hypothetical protein
LGFYLQQNQAPHDPKLDFSGRSGLGGRKGAISAEDLGLAE